MPLVQEGHTSQNRDLITSPAYLVIKAANEFHTKAVRPNQADRLHPL